MRRGRRCSLATAGCAEGKLCGHSTMYLGPSLTPTLRLLPIQDWRRKPPERVHRVLTRIPVGVSEIQAPPTLVEVLEEGMGAHPRD